MNLKRGGYLALDDLKQIINFEKSKIAITYHASVFAVPQDANISQT